MWTSWQEPSLHSAVQNRAHNLCLASLLWKTLCELFESAAFPSVCLCSLLPKELINRQHNWMPRPEAREPPLPLVSCPWASFPVWERGTSSLTSEGCYDMSFHALNERVQCSWIEQLLPCQSCAMKPAYHAAIAPARNLSINTDYYGY